MSNLRDFISVRSNIVAKTTSYTINAGECDGRTYTNEGCAGKVTFTLPSAEAGLEVSFIVEDANGIRVDPGASDDIRLGADTSSTGIESTTVGATVRLKCINATNWIGIQAGYINFATL